MSSRNVRRPRRKNRGSSSAVVTRAELRRENHLLENGSKLRPQPHPTDFQAVPWFPLTVQVQNFITIHYGATTTAGLVSIFQAIRAQTGISTDTVLQVRVQSMRVWGPIVAMNSSTALQPVRVRFYAINPVINPSPVAGAVLEDTISYPDQVSRAALGFVWPKAQQALAISPSTTAIAIARLTEGESPGNLAYVRILFRPVPPPSVMEDFVLT